MRLLLAAAWAALQGDGSVRVCVHDAATGAPLPGARITAEGGDQARRLVEPCASLPAGRWTVRRVGYRPATVDVAAVASGTRADAAPGERTVVVTLVPLAAVPGATMAAPATMAAIATLDTLQVRAAPGAMPARASATLRTESARAAGLGGTTALVAALPYVQWRTARGETGLSVRGARREQVAVTLDGLVLNDPATGIADLGDLPLAAVAAATVLPGADPLGAGPGAGGGVVALQSATRREATVRAGAFGAREAQGAWQGTVGDLVWRGGAAHWAGRNDFPFVNRAGATGADARERRVNNDDTRTSLFGALLAPRGELVLLATRGERGLVGPANVRAYDADRLHTARALLRGRVPVGPVQVTAGGRGLDLAYRDPTRPVLDASARVLAGDLEAAGVAGPLRLRAGGGGDGVRATGGIAQSRTRGFVAAEWSGARAASRGSPEDRRDGVARVSRAAAGARLDAVSGSGVQPSLSLAAESERHGVRASGPLRGAWRGIASARLAQAVRVPTLYDLFFASPQRLAVRPLRPERVLLDAEAALGASLARPALQLDWRGALVARETRDAIVWFPGNFAWSPSNVPRERLLGADAHLRIETPRGDLAAFASRYDAALRVDGLRIPTPYVARHAAGAQAALRGGPWQVTARAQWMGRRPFTAGPRDPAFELPTVGTLDLALARTVTLKAAALLATVALDNATNRDWQSVRGFPMPGRAWSVAITLTPRSQP